MVQCSYIMSSACPQLVSASLSDMIVAASPITLNYTMVKVFFAGRITKIAISCSLLLLFIFTLTNTLFDFNMFANIYTCFPPLSVTGAAGPMTLTFPSPSPGPRPLSAAPTFYIQSVEIAIPLRVILISVFHYGWSGSLGPLGLLFVHFLFNVISALFAITLCKSCMFPISSLYGIGFSISLI